VTVEGGAVEPGALEDQLDRRLPVAALGGDLDQRCDDQRPLRAAGCLAGLRAEH
jgi:hypothetical protein